MQTPASPDVAPVQLPDVPPPPPPPAPPALPQIAGVPAPRATPIVGRPLTAQEVAQIRARRTELSNQLTSAEGRRRRLAQEIRTSDASSRPGLEQRMRVLDERMMQLETDIAETGRQLTSAPSGLVSTTASAANPFGLGPGQVTALGSVFTVVVLAPLAVAAARLMWRRASAPTRSAGPDVSGQLRGLEQAVEAIAVEVERVSEGQRFVTRLLSEGPARSPLGVGQGAAEPLGVREEAALHVPRRGS